MATEVEIKDPYFYTKIAKRIIIDQFNQFGNMKQALAFMSLEIANPNDKEGIIVNIKDMRDIFNKALKELGVDENNDKITE